MSADRAYVCRICQKAVAYEGRLPEAYPFCSPRCRRVDLGRWLRGQYSLERELTDEELAELPLPQPGERAEAEPA